MGKEQKVSIFRITLDFANVKVRLEALDEDSLHTAISQLEAIGASVSRRGRVPSGKVDELAAAVGELHHVSYEQAKAWLDKEEISQRGFKNRVRREPAIMALLAKYRAESGESTGLLAGVKF